MQAAANLIWPFPACLGSVMSQVESNLSMAGGFTNLKLECLKSYPASTYINGYDYMHMQLSVVDYIYVPG